MAAGDIAVARTVAALREAVAGWRKQQERIALVPTMGALHRGHLALVEAARRHCERVVASLFVNPTQFGPREDFAAYPRSEAADLARFSEAGVGLVFAPTIEEVYPAGWVTTGRGARRGAGQCRRGPADRACGTAPGRVCAGLPRSPRCRRFVADEPPRPRGAPPRRRASRPHSPDRQCRDLTRHGAPPIARIGTSWSRCIWGHAVTTLLRCAPGDDACMRSKRRSCPPSLANASCTCNAISAPTV